MRRLGVGEGAMTDRELDFEVAGERAQAVFGQAGSRSDAISRVSKSGPADGFLRGQKAEVERDVLPDDADVANERLQVGGNLGEDGRMLEVFRTDAGEALDVVRQLAARLDGRAGRSRPHRRA